MLPTFTFGLTLLMGLSAIRDKEYSFGGIAILE
jgi:hypothetical protein